MVTFLRKGHRVIKKRCRVQGQPYLWPITECAAGNKDNRLDGVGGNGIQSKKTLMFEDNRISLD